MLDIDFVAEKVGENLELGEGISICKEEDDRVSLKVDGKERSFEVLAPALVFAMSANGAREMIFNIKNINFVMKIDVLKVGEEQ